MIRHLKPGESVPDSEPRRYLNSAGYVRLRWRIAPQIYVETFEHRVFDGRVTTAPHVHHRDHDKTNNDPSNLLPVTESEHRRHHRLIDWAEAVRLYKSGMSTPEVGRQIGADASQVYRILVASGVTPRSISESLQLNIDPVLVTELHRAGVRNRRIAKVLGCSATAIDNLVERLGLTPHREGRPSNAEIARAKAAIRNLRGVA